MKKALLLITLLLAAWLTAPAQRLLIGTYTDTGSHGIYSLAFDAATGRATMLDSLAVVNPSFLTPHADGTKLYAVSELSDSRAALHAIAFDAATGAMRLLNTVATEGADPCFVEQRGDMVLTANYTGGSMSVFKLRPDGTLAAGPSLYAGHTGGQRPQQSTAHIHTSRFFGGDIVLATDFSADQILRYRLRDGRLLPDGVAGQTLPNSGPRHLEWTRNRRYVYSIDELSGTVTVFRQRRGRLQRLQTIASDSVGGGGCADIHLLPGEKFLYASNRLKADGISIFKVEKGRLTKTGYQLTGIHPRNFAITPDGRYLLCACRDSDVVMVFSIDSATGQLKNTHQDIHIKHPVCVKVI